MPAAPAAPPLPSAPAPVQTGSAIPVSRGTIHVTASGMSAAPSAPADAPPKPATPEPAPAPKPSAKDEMFEKLGQKIKPGTGKDPGIDKPLNPEAKPSEPADPDAEPAPADPNAEPAPAEPTAAKPGEAAPKGKANPWKLMEEHKTRAAKLEAEVVELKKLVPNEAARKQELAELETLRTRSKELEDEIRYVNYAKSPEFKEKYEAPYKQAWAKAMSELREITIEDPTSGDSRPVAANDVLELVNLPLGKARELANTMFGDFADDVMAHRKEIKNLFEAQAAALEEARTKGAEREKAMSETHNATLTKLKTQAAELWNRANEAALKDEKVGKLFTPVEGDDEGNSRLTKGFELVDQAFKENPLDPRLTPEQREGIIRRHAAVRHRAAAFGRLKYQYDQASARIKEMEAELAQFKGSAPTTTGGTAGKTQAAPMSARDQMLENMGKLVKRV